MRTEEISNAPPRFAILAGVLSFLIPGLGQLIQGRLGKGLLFMISLLGLFFLGQYLGNWKNVYIPQPDGFAQQPARGPRLPLNGILQRWHYAGQFFIGIAAWPALWQFYDLPMPESEFWHDYQRSPDERELNQILVNSDKSPDVGWIYTVIAGMLNLLVIYDAFAGPALRSSAARPRESLSATAAPLGQGVTV